MTERYELVDRPYPGHPEAVIILDHERMIGYPVSSLTPFERAFVVTLTADPAALEALLQGGPEYYTPEPDHPAKEAE